jgi:type IV pilus assembly protein PilM
MLFHPHPHAFGLDIGDLSIKVVALEHISGRKRQPAFRLVTAREVTLPPGLIVNGEFQSPEQVQTYVAHLLKGGTHDKPLTGTWVVATIPEIHSFIKVIHVPKRAEDVIDEDIMSVAKQHIPFDEQSYYLDWQPLPAMFDDQPYTRILIGAVPIKIADMYTAFLESMGLGIIALEIEAMAIARSLMTATKVYTGQARALLDIGATQTSLIIHDHDTVQFSKTIPFSGEYIDTAISQTLRISKEEAEELKKVHGVSFAKEYGSALGLIKQHVDELVDTIERSFQFYYTHFTHSNTISHVTMSGGGSNMKQLPELLTSRLGITCAQGSVWKNLGTKPGILPDESRSLGYATAIGLALRASDNPYHQFDMI